jgi:hypothetical protein
MTERTRRAMARKKFFEGYRPNKPSSIANSFGRPIGKPLCIRSMRRWYRAVKLHNERAAEQHPNGENFLHMLRGMSGKDHLQDMSSGRIARVVRYSKRSMNIEENPAYAV